MSGFDLAGYSLFATAAVFIITAFLTSRKVYSPWDFFHNSWVPNNVVSLTAANITLGTGFAYILAGVDQHGIATLFLPMALILGYQLLAAIVPKSDAYIVKQGQNLLQAVQEQLDILNPADPLKLARPITICLVFAYVIILSFEIIASASFIVPFVTQSSGTYAPLVVATLLFVPSLLTVLFGGVRGVFRTDWIQISGIFVATLILIWSLSKHINYPAHNLDWSKTLKVSSSSIMGVVSGCIAAISTQFYSILNWSGASHVIANDRAKVFRQVGWCTGLFLLAIVFMAVLAEASGESLFSVIQSAYTPVAQRTDGSAWMICAIVTLGLCSVTCSTADSVIFVVTQFTYENILGLSSRNTSGNPALLRRIRFLIFLTFGACFSGLVFLHNVRQDLFTLLLVIVAGIPVFAPLFALLSYLSRDSGRFVVLNRISKYSYIGLFVASYATAGFTVFQKPESVGYVGTASFLVSSMLSFRLYKKAKRLGLGHPRLVSNSPQAP